MAIKFSGEYEVGKAPEEVYAFLTDPKRFAARLPGFRGIAVENDAHFTVKLNVGFPYVKDDTDVRLDLVDCDRPWNAHYKGQSSVVGGKVTSLASFYLAETVDGTKVKWELDVQVSGLLALIPQGIFESLGEKQAQKIIADVQSALQ